MITHAHIHTQTEALIQSADRETRQTTSIMASELIGNGGGEEKGGRREADVEVEGWVKGAGGSWGLVEDFCNEVYLRRMLPLFSTTYCLQLLSHLLSPTLHLKTGLSRDTSPLPSFWKKGVAGR